MARGAAMLLALASCASELSPASLQVPIVGGEEDPGDPAVVAILISGETRCTGTLVAPHVVLTAAHCIDPTLDLSFRLDAARVHPGPDARTGAATFGVREARAHPGWRPTTQANDLAVLLLDRASGIEPAPMNAAALDESAVGSTTRLVGFGITGQSATDHGVRRQATSIVRSVAAAELTYGDTPGQTCTGDSGGPALVTLGGREVLAAVTSRGDAACVEYGIAVRVDTSLESFIQPYLDEHPVGCLGDGDCHADCVPWDPDCGPEPAPVGASCAVDGDCLSGVCIAAIDDGTVRYCSQECACEGGDCETCPTGPGGQALACTILPGTAQSACAYAPPTPGAVGAPCRDGVDCAGMLCVVPDGDWQAICTRACGESGAVECPDGFDCQEVASEPSARACLPASAAGGCGCTAAGGGERIGWPWLLLALLAGAPRLSRLLRGSLS